MCRLVSINIFSGSLKLHWCICFHLLWNLNVSSSIVSCPYEAVKRTTSHQQQKQSSHSDINKVRLDFKKLQNVITVVANENIKLIFVIILKLLQSFPSLSSSIHSILILEWIIYLLFLYLVCLHHVCRYCTVWKAIVHIFIVEISKLDWQVH